MKKNVSSFQRQKHTCTVSSASFVKHIFLANLLQTISEPFDIVAAQLMKLLLPPHFLNCITEFPLWPRMKSITHPPTAWLDKWPPLAATLCCQAVSLFSVSPSFLLSLVVNRRMQKGRTELCLTYPSSQKSSSTTAKVKMLNAALSLRNMLYCSFSNLSFVHLFLNTLLFQYYITPEHFHQTQRCHWTLKER